MGRAGGAQAQNAAFISRNRGFGDPAYCCLRVDTTPETPRERFNEPKTSRWSCSRYGSPPSGCTRRPRPLARLWAGQSRRSVIGRRDLRQSAIRHEAVSSESISHQSTPRRQPRGGVRAWLGYDHANRVMSADGAVGHTPNRQHAWGNFDRSELESGAWMALRTSIAAWRTVHPRREDHMSAI